MSFRSVVSFLVLVAIVPSSIGDIVFDDAKTASILIPLEGFEYQELQNEGTLNDREKRSLSSTAVDVGSTLLFGGKGLGGVTNGGGLGSGGILGGLINGGNGGGLFRLNEDFPGSQKAATGQTQVANNALGALGGLSGGNPAGLGVNGAQAGGVQQNPSNTEVLHSVVQGKDGTYSGNSGLVNTNGQNTGALQNQGATVNTYTVRQTGTGGQNGETIETVRYTNGNNGLSQNYGTSSAFVKTVNSNGGTTSGIQNSAGASNGITTIPGGVDGNGGQNLISSSTKNGAVTGGTSNTVSEYTYQYTTHTAGGTAPNTLPGNVGPNPTPNNSAENLRVLGGNNGGTVNEFSKTYQISNSNINGNNAGYSSGVAGNNVPVKGAQTHVVHSNNGATSNTVSEYTYQNTNTHTGGGAAPNTLPGSVGQNPAPNNNADNLKVLGGSNGGTVTEFSKTYQISNSNINGNNAGYASGVAGNNVPVNGAQTHIVHNNNGATSNTVSEYTYQNTNTHTGGSAAPNTLPGNVGQSPVVNNNGENVKALALNSGGTVSESYQASNTNANGHNVGHSSGVTGNNVQGNGAQNTLHSNTGGASNSVSEYTYQYTTHTAGGTAGNTLAGNVVQSPGPNNGGTVSELSKTYQTSNSNVKGNFVGNNVQTQPCSSYVNGVPVCGNNINSIPGGFVGNEGQNLQTGAGTLNSLNNGAANSYSQSYSYSSSSQSGMNGAANSVQNGLAGNSAQSLLQHSGTRGVGSSGVLPGGLNGGGANGFENINGNGNGGGIGGFNVVPSLFGLSVSPSLNNGGLGQSLTPGFGDQTVYCRNHTNIFNNDTVSFSNYTVICTKGTPLPTMTTTTTTMAPDDDDDDEDDK